MSIAIVAAVLAATSSAPDQELAQPRVVVQWRAPSKCPAFEDIAGSIEALSGVLPVSSSDAADLDVEATIDEGELGYVLNMTLRREGASRTRKLDAEDCVVLGRAAAIVVAVALDPVRTAASWPRAPAPESEPEPQSEPESQPAPEPKSEPEPEPVRTPESGPTPVRALERRAFSRLEYGGAAALAIGGRILPGVGPGFEVAPFMGTARVHVRLPVQVRPFRRATLPDNASAGATFTLVAAGPRVCPNVMPVPHRVRIPLCVGADFGAVVAGGRGPDVRDARDVFSFWASATAEAGANVQLAPRVSAFAAFELAVSLSRPRFFLEGAGLLHETARLGPRGMLGVQFHRRRDLL